MYILIHTLNKILALTGKAVTNVVFTITVGGRAGRVQTEAWLYGFNDW